MRGSWQVTRRKNVNLCHNCVWRKICRAPSPLPVYSSSCHCICIKKCKTWIWSAYKYDKYAKICTPTLLMVPCRCKWAWVWLRWLQLLAGRGFFAVAPSVPGLRLWRLVLSQHWTKIRPKCSPRLSCSCTDTLRTTGYYPWISWVNPVYLVISLVNPWFQKLSRFQVDSGASKRSHETCCRSEAARCWDEWNVWHEYLWRDIPG